MVKKILIIVSMFLLTGCWDYVNLNDITIVAGIAVDKDEKTNKYKLSFEIIDLADSAKSKTIKTKIIESKGNNIFDAVRNAKKRTMNKLYFSNAQVVVISNQIAKNDGLKSIMSWFLRDAEIRETIDFVISQENTAKELLIKKSVDNPITSFEIKKILESDSRVTSSTENIEVYKIFNTFKNNVGSLSLPLFHLAKNDNKLTTEANGIAVFKDDKLLGKLNPTESKYYLFVVDKVNGGILTLKTDNNINNIGLEISKSRTSKNYSYKNKKIKIKINTNTKVYLAEYDNQYKQVNEKEIRKIEKNTEAMIKKNINKVVEKVKNEFKSDIFNFSNLINNKDPKLWKRIKKDWDDLFVDIDIVVKPDVQIVNTSFLK